MDNRKIFHLLALLTEEDKERFTLYLDSPYFNTSKVLSTFWKEWKTKVMGRQDSAELTIEAFIKGTSLKATRFDRLCSQLYVKAINFLSQRGFDDSVVLQEVLMARAALSRESSLQTSMNLAKKVTRNLAKKPESPERYLAQMVHTLHIIEARIISRKPGKEMLKEFANMFDYLDEFYTSKRLNMECGALNLEYIVQQDQKELLDELKKKVQSIPAKKSGSLLSQIYSLILTIQLDPTSNYRFPELLAMMEGYQGKIKEESANEIFHFALNHCIRQINIGDAAYLGYTLDLYIQLLENGSILIQGKLTPQQFKNMVVLGCRIGRLDWVKGFMEEYGTQLLDDHSGIALDYNQAVYQFHRNDYANVVGLLKKVIEESSFDLFYGLDARMYLWKAYFESMNELGAKDIDEMYKLYDSFRLYIDRHTKISELHKLQYRNFVRFFRRFLLLVVDQGQGWPADLQVLLEELEVEKDIANKTWFLEKIHQALETNSG